MLQIQCGDSFKEAVTVPPHDSFNYTDTVKWHDSFDAYGYISILLIHLFSMLQTRVVIQSSLLE